MKELTIIRVDQRGTAWFVTSCVKCGKKIHASGAVDDVIGTPMRWTEELLCRECNKDIPLIHPES